VTNNAIVSRDFPPCVEWVPAGNHALTLCGQPRRRGAPDGAPVAPPSTINSTALTYDESSEARKSTAFEVGVEMFSRMASSAAPVGVLPEMPAFAKTIIRTSSVNERRAWRSTDTLVQLPEVNNNDRQMDVGPGVAGGKEAAEKVANRLVAAI
jgi:hypothetical protein